MENKEVLRLENIAKSFSSNYVLQDIEFSLNKGEVRALVGENGAGKSTMIKIIAGALKADRGTIYLEGKQTEFASPKESLAAGISVMYQELDLLPQLSVADNIFLGIEKKSKWRTLRRKEMGEIVDAHLEEMHLQVKKEEKVGKLPIVAQQMTAAIKAMVHDAKILIMDEPSSSLTNKELEILFGLIRRLKEKGLAIIYVSHRLEEIFQICDSVTVLLNGRMVSTSLVNQVTKEQIIQQMVGKKINENRLNTRKNYENTCVLEAQQIHSKDLKDVSFQVMQGEIYGILGLAGSGAIELGKVLYGVHRIEGGTLKIHGRPAVLKSPWNALKNSVSYVSDERRAYGIFQDMEAQENGMISSLENYVSFQPLLLLDHKKMQKQFLEYVKEFSIKIQEPQQKIRYLSGGNQQKILIARALLNDTDIIVLSCPTKGIDVGAKFEIYQILLECAQKGKTVIVVSQEITELVQICDRILMLKQGKVYKEYAGEDIRESLIYHELLE